MTIYECSLYKKGKNSFLSGKINEILRLQLLYYTVYINVTTDGCTIYKIHMILLSGKLKKICSNIQLREMIITLAQ